MVETPTPYPLEGECWWDVTRVLCNKQLQQDRDRYADALTQCNADKASIRMWMQDR
ncbi:MAG: hypothetical protein ABIR16_09030 [Dokdonella sp.]